MSALLTLLLQMAVVVATARLLGWLFRRLHQPPVVGEMAAGILLGPSLLGWVAPGVFAHVFPTASLGALNMLSQVGLLLFMFLVGLDFDPALLRGRGHTALITSWTSIVLPFALGAALALPLYPRVAPAGVRFTGFTLFMGAAMSVTAFPVLARILTERRLTHTRVGAMALACAAVDDVSAWTILAFVVGIARSAALDRPLWLTIAGTLAYAALVAFGVRPLLRATLEVYYERRGRLTQNLLGAALVLMTASAWTTEWLGVHALFGAFAAGAAMPKNRRLIEEMSGKLRDLTMVFLLPLFFAFTGLRTHIGLVSGVELWLWTAVILLAAVAGKLGGSALAARATGLSWREATSIGLLMNTRGLMELVILSVGLDLGVISPTLFTMLVLMALITTAMTTPLLEWVYPARLRRDGAEPVEVRASAA